MLNQRVAQHLIDIVEAIGRNDPHFRYAIEVQPAGSEPIVRPYPEAVVTTACKVDDHIIVCHVCPKYRGATEDAGERLQIGLTLADDAARRLDRLLAVGGEPVVLSGSEIADLQLPPVGHQRTDAGELWVRITALEDTTPTRMRLVLTTATGDRVVVMLRRTSLTRGTSGGTSLWVCPRECVTLTAVGDGGVLRIRVSPDHLVGYDGPISAIADDLELLRNLRPGTSLALALERGPLDQASPIGTCPEPLVDPGFLAALEALRVIQQYTTTVVTVPSELTESQVVDLIETAALLAGIPATHDMRRWNCAIQLSAEAVEPGGTQSVFGGPFALGMVCESETTIQLPHQAIELAQRLVFVRFFRSARVGSIEPGDSIGTVSVALEPGPLPFWIDQRIADRDGYVDSLHERLLGIDEPITTDDLIAELTLAL